jgi:hypothetical protein
MNVSKNSTFGGAMQRASLAEWWAKLLTLGTRASCKKDGTEARAAPREE